LIYAAKKLDAGAKLTTSVVLAMFLTIAYLVFFHPLEGAPFWAILIVYAIGAMLMTLPLIAYLYSPNAYELTDKALLVRRRVASITIPYQEILQVDYLSEAFLQDLERAGGNGGVFGYYGEFRAGRDPYYLYITSRKGAVLITTTNLGKLVISPESRSLVTDLRERIH